MGLLTELLVLVLAVLEKSADKFSDYHQKTLMAIIQATIAIGPPQNAAQTELVAAIDAFFNKAKAGPASWEGFR